MYLVSSGTSSKGQSVEKAKARARARLGEVKVADGSSVASTSTSSSPAQRGQFDRMQARDASNLHSRQPSEAAQADSPFSSSDFEAISESEVPSVESATRLYQQGNALQPSKGRPFGLDRSRSPVGRQRQQQKQALFTLSPEKDDEGDDEQSAVEDSEEMRGRARTRERRRRDDNDENQHPVTTRNVVEDALRSSLALLMAMSPVQQSLSPAMSQVNMQSMLANKSTARSPAKTPESPAQIEAFSRLHSNAPARPSPFASALSTALATTASVENNLDQTVPEAASSSSSNESGLEVALESSSDEGTELGPRGPYGDTRSRPVAIPRPQYGRSNSATVTSPPALSPYQSRTLPLQPSSASPPTWSRKKLRRGRHRRESPSPGPASMDERRRARDRSKDSIASSTLIIEQTDAPPPLTAAAVGDKDSSRQTGKMTFSALGLEEPSPLDDRWRAGNAKNDDDIETPSSSEEASSLPSDEPHLASSVPTLDLSSEPDDGRSTSPAAARRGQKAAPEHDGATRASSWWSSWFGSSFEFEIKTWHVVGMAGVLIGVGLASSPLVKLGKSLAAKAGFNGSWTSFQFR